MSDSASELPLQPDGIRTRVPLTQEINMGPGKPRLVVAVRAPGQPVSPEIEQAWAEAESEKAWAKINRGIRKRRRR